MVSLLITSFKCVLHKKGIFYGMIIHLLSLLEKKEWETVSFDKYWSRHLARLAVHDQISTGSKLKMH